MKIQCDVCEKAPATVICCADEAALCAKCDVEVHAANKLASKHQRLLLECLSNKLPRCDICQEKAAFIFCVEDRALFCKECDENIHSANNLAANHQRYLATGIRVALNSNCNKNNSNTQMEPPPPTKPTIIAAAKSITPPHVSSITSSPAWAVDDLLQFSEYESSDKKEQLEFGEVEWWKDIGLFGDQQIGHEEASSAAEVPQLNGYGSHTNNYNNSMNSSSYRSSSKFYMPNKKPRIEYPEDDDEFFTVPDLG